MSAVLWITVLRVLTVVAIGVSGALFVDYANPMDATFCGPDSGCNDVQRSGLGYIGGYLGLPLQLALLVNTPLIGLVAYGTVLYAAIKPGSLVHILAYVGGAGALALIGIQAFVVKAFCWLCMIVDVSAVGIALAAFMHARAAASEASEPAAPEPADPDDKDGPYRARVVGRRGGEPVAAFTWPVLAVAVVMIAAVWPQLKPAPDVPFGIRSYYVEGKINVVEFADFECPFCRRLHPIIKKLADEYGDQVNFVRLNYPLESHPQARPAARSYLCAADQGKSEPMADLLFDVEELSPETNRQLAEKLELDLAAYDACVKDEKTDKRIDAESQVLVDAGLQGLPTTYVGGKRIVGVREEVTFRDAFEQAKKGGQDVGVPPFIYWPVSFLLLSGIVFLGRRRR